MHKRVACLAFYTRRKEAPSAASRPEPGAEQFMAWLRSQGLPEQPLELRDCGAEGRGLVATRAVKKGQRLLSIPKELMITAPLACAESPLCSYLQAAGVPEWTLLAVFLVQLRQQAQAGSSGGTDGGGKWAPYVRLLPANPGTVLEWPAADVAKCLAGSPLLAKARTILGAAKASWAELQPHLRQAQAAGLLSGGAAAQLNEGSLNWAFGILLSRLVRLPSAGNAQALLPWADLLNHSCSISDAFLDWDEEVQAVVCRPQCDYAPGQQVYISYGNKPR